MDFVQIMQMHVSEFDNLKKQIDSAYQKVPLMFRTSLPPKDDIKSNIDRLRDISERFLVHFDGRLSKLEQNNVGGLTDD